MAPSCHHHPFLPDPWGVVLHPIIPPLPDKTTGHRPYHSVCGHRPVSLPPLTTAINIFTPLNGPILTIGGFILPPPGCPAAHQKLHFCPQKTALSSCFQSPWRRPSRGGLSYLRRPLLPYRDGHCANVKKKGSILKFETPNI